MWSREKARTFAIESKKCVAVASSPPPPYLWVWMFKATNAWFYCWIALCNRNRIPIQRMLASTVIFCGNTTITNKTFQCAQLEKAHSKIVKEYLLWPHLWAGLIVEIRCWQYKWQSKAQQSIPGHFDLFIHGNKSQRPYSIASRSLFVMLENWMCWINIGQQCIQI